MGTHLPAPVCHLLAPHCSLCLRASLRFFNCLLDHTTDAQAYGKDILKSLRIDCIKFTQFRAKVGNSAPTDLRLELLIHGGRDSRGNLMGARAANRKKTYKTKAQPGLRERE